MALFQCSIYSESFMKCTQVNVTLPLPNVSNMEEGHSLRFPKHGEKFQTLWLLHCGTGDQNEYLRFSRIEEYAQQNFVAVVMPNVDNSYYCNLPYHRNYYDYYTEELPRIMRSIFPLASGRENNFIGGASMGGFGAFAAALKNPDKYGAAFSLSGGLNFRGNTFGNQVNQWQTAVNKNLFGETDQYYDPHAHDLLTITNDFLNAKVPQPKLYAVHGLQDSLVSDACPHTIHAMQKAGLKIDYFEENGGHNWDLWDSQLRKIMDWLPLTHDFVQSNS